MFSDRAGTAGLGNPFTGGSDGLVAFHVAGGSYKITVTSGGTVRTFRYVGIATGSENDFDNAAWSTFTPTITAGSGTFTTVSASGRYKQVGKVVYVSISIVITTNGTAATSVLATLPVSANASAAPTFQGRGNVVSGKQLQAKAASVSQIAITNYDNTYPGATGETLLINGAYEAA